MIRARSARLRRVVAARTHAVSCARSCAATANLVATAMPCLHHAITGMASELTRRDTSDCDAVVDTGAYCLTLPAAWKDALGAPHGGAGGCRARRSAGGERRAAATSQDPDR